MAEKRRKFSRIRWQDLDRIVLFHLRPDDAKGLTKKKPSKALAHKSVLENFARHNGFSFTVETVPVPPDRRRDPAPTADPSICEDSDSTTFDDLHSTASLLDSAGVPREDLFRTAATRAEQSAAGTVADPAPGPWTTP